MKRRNKTTRLTYTSWPWIFFYAWYGGLLVGTAITEHSISQWIFTIVLNVLLALYVRKQMHNNIVYSRIEGFFILRDAEKETP